MAKQYVIPKVGAVNDLEAGIKIVMPKAGVVTQFPTIAVGGLSIPVAMHHYTKNIGSRG